MASEMMGQPSRRFHHRMPVRRHLAERKRSIKNFFASAWLICYTIKEWDSYRALAVGIGMLIGVLVVLVDVLLKGFSLRGLSAITFGLAVGALVGQVSLTTFGSL